MEKQPTTSRYAAGIGRAVVGQSNKMRFPHVRVQIPGDAVVSHHKF